MKLILFDIDGTLISSGGAGLRAMVRTLERRFGIVNGFDGVPTAGRLDPLILADALAAAGRPGLDAAALDAFRAEYCDLLREELATTPIERQRVLPGVRVLLDDLAGRDVAVALLTGNFETSAFIKLQHFALAPYFAFGAFGEDASSRSALLPIAIDRARQRGHAVDGPSDVLVIGDTPHDVDCAHEWGATALAVATGSFDRDALSATGARIVVEDLSDSAPVHRWLGGA